MTEKLNKLKLEIIKNRVITDIVEPSGKDDWELSSTNSISEFPTASIKSTNSEINKVFLDYKKSEIVRISVADDNITNYSVLFEGEFHTKKIQHKKNEENLLVNIHVIHSFFKLSILPPISKHTFKNIKFRDIVTQFVDLAEIPSKIYIDDILGNSLVNGLSSQTNAFRLFKEICFLKNALVTFNADNSVNIEYKKDKLMKIHTKAPIVIPEEEIISMERIDNI